MGRQQLNLGSYIIILVPPKNINPWILSAQSYPAGKSFEEVARDYGFKESQILRLAGNESTLGPSPQAIKAAQRELARSNFYGEPFSESLTQKLEQTFMSQGLDLKRSAIVVGNGMDSVIDHIADLFLDSRSSIVSLPPSFVYYESATQRRGARVISLRRSSPESSANAAFSSDPDKILSAIESDTKLIFVCSPNNPTGNSFSPRELDYLAAETAKRQIHLFVDEAYIEFSRHESVANLVNQYPNLIVGRTFSKAYALAGFRVGYAIMSRELQQEYHKIMTPFLLSRPSLAAASAALDDKHHLAKVIESAQKGREQICKEFRRLAIEHYPSDANFVLFKTQQEAPHILEALLKAGIIIRGQKQVCKHSLRVSVGSKAENQRFIKALETIICTA